MRKCFWCHKAIPRGGMTRPKGKAFLYICSKCTKVDDRWMKFFGFGSRRSKSRK